MYKYTIAQNPGKYEVYINLISSPAGRYLSRRPYVINHIKEVVAPMKLRGPRIVIERDMGRVIGNTDIVETSDKDTIYYAQPYRKDTYARYAKNRYPSPSNTLTIVIELDVDGNYEVLDTWIGPSSPPFPGDVNATDASKDYWQTHALVQDAQAIQSKTITRLCPY